MSTTRRTLIVLHALIGTGAVDAGQAFVRDPRGGAQGTPTEWFERSPFPDFHVPGLFPATAIGSSSLPSALALRRRRPRAPLAGLATGLLPVAWIAIRSAGTGFRGWSAAAARGT